MWKVCKYILLDLARNRFVLLYALLQLLLSWGLFMVQGDPLKAVITLTQVELALVPLLMLVFTIIHFFNQYEFTVLLAVQPLRRRTILTAQFAALAFALLFAFLFGVGLPLLVYAPTMASLTLLLAGSALTLVFIALGLAVAVVQRDRARAVGLGLVTWVMLVLVYDALLLWIMFAFSDRPIEPLVVVLASLNPIDLSRILVMLQIDLAALMGYTGAVYNAYFGSALGMLISLGTLLLWTALPGWIAARRFARKDL